MSLTRAQIDEKILLMRQREAVIKTKIAGYNKEVDALEDEARALNHEIDKLNELWEKADA